jgi:hypothetical protein
LNTFGATWFVFLSLIALCLGAVAMVVYTVILVRRKEFTPSLIRVIGLLTIWIVIYDSVELVRWLVISNYGSFATTEIPDSVRVVIFIYWLLGKITALLTFSLMALYLVHAKQSKGLPRQSRILYQIGFVLLPPVSMLIYYLKGLMRESEA